MQSNQPEIQASKNSVPSVGPAHAHARPESEWGLELERVAREMGLAIPGGASGLLHWLPAGMRLRAAVMSMSLRMHEALGYGEVKSPCLAPAWLFERSGHLEKYSELMYSAKPGSEQGDEASGSELMLRPMSCPNHLSIYLSKRRSVNELPWRAFEFGEVFRSESSGSLAFLLRQRQFCQDDSHVVCRLPQVGQVAKDWLSMARQACAWMDCGEPIMRLASRPPSRMGSDADWDLCESLLAAELDASGPKWEWAPGEGAFYGPKMELALRDALGRPWQLGVFQLDLNLPQRFDLRADGLEQGEPLALAHHAVFGSIERAIGVLLACRGKDLPPKVNPNALAVLPVSAKQMEAAREFACGARAILGARAWLCDIDAPLGAKVARAKEAGFARVAVVGAKEAAMEGLWASVDGAPAGPAAACSGLA